MNNMMPRSFGIALIVCCLVLPSCTKSELKNRGMAFTGLTIIDTSGGPSISNMTVVVKDDKIISIQKTHESSIGKETEIIDASGKYMIPGLFDMHVHGICDENNQLAMVANGVTFVRDMGNVIIKPGGPDGFTYTTRQEMIDTILETRKKINNGELLSPTIITPGVILTGPIPPEYPFSSPEFQWALISEEETRQAVRYLAQRGVDFLKVHTLPSRAVYFAVADEAKTLGLPFAGHVPLSISAVEAIQAGQVSIEHQEGVKPYMAQAKDDQEVANQKRAELFDIYAQNPDTWHVPTLVVTLGGVNAGELYRNPEAEPLMRYISPELFAWWKKYWPPEMFESEVSDKRMALEEKIGWVGEMAERGIKIMAGTDFGALFVYPGFSIHDELILLNRAGLSPMEVLQTATLNPARFLDMEDGHGTIEVGKIADLVILDENPLDDIANTQKIAGVVVRGRYLSRTELSDILRKIRQNIAKKSSAVENK